MFINYKCINEECVEFEKVISKNVSLADLDTVIQRCDVCCKEVVRVWSGSSASIKTGDGFKS